MPLLAGARVEMSAKHPADPAASGLEHVLITHELTRRPARAPDHETEVKALGALAEAIASSP